MEYKDVVRDFATRTLENYKMYHGEYEITDLINSSLGLFIFPQQKFFNNISDTWISNELLSELKKNAKSNYKENLNLKNICRHIRNGISHYHLKIKVNPKKEITGVIISDVNPKNEKENFKIEFSIELLKKFFIEFSETIIEK